MSNNTPRNTVRLRDVQESDLTVFFEHQRDAEANEMAAFPPREKDMFFPHWQGILADDSCIKKTVLLDNEVAGNIVCFEHDGRWLIGYWIGKEFWGKGIATRALAAFTAEVKTRPLHAFVAKHNTGSIRVLEKCGFTVSGEDKHAASTGGEVVEEFIYTLK